MRPSFGCIGSSIGIIKRVNILAQHTVLIHILTGVFLQFHLKACHPLEEMIAPLTGIGTGHTGRKIVIEHTAARQRTELGILPLHTGIMVSLLIARYFHYRTIRQRIITFTQLETIVLYVQTGFHLAHKLQSFQRSDNCRKRHCIRYPILAIARLLQIKLLVPRRSGILRLLDREFRDTAWRHISYRSIKNSLVCQRSFQKTQRHIIIEIELQPICSTYGKLSVHIILLQIILHLIHQAFLVDITQTYIIRSLFRTALYTDIMRMADSTVLEIIIEPVGIGILRIIGCRPTVTRLIDIYTGKLGRIRILHKTFHFLNSCIGNLMRTSHTLVPQIGIPRPFQ